MPELIDLGFCPNCFEDLTDTPSSVIIHARFCRICADRIRGDRQREEDWLAYAIWMQKEVNR